jgi:CheY-like chemotaxis protein
MSKKILLADDSITIQKVISLTFAGEDYKITSVDNGADAIVKAREIMPDIILADVIMPQRNGYEVCEAVKGDPGLRNIPVLLLAGTFEPFDEDQAKKVGADGYIIKPFESQALAQKVKELMSAREAMPAVPEAPRPAPAPPVVPTPPAVRPTVPPIVTPEAPKPAPQPVAAPEVRPVEAPEAPAPEGEEEFWGTLFEEVEEKEALKEEMPVEARVAEAPEEEIWEVEEIEEAAAVEKEEDFWESFAFEEEEGVAEAPSKEAVEEEVFALGAEETFLGEEIAPAPPEEEFIFAGEVEEKEEGPEIELEEAPIELAEEPIEVIEEAIEAGPEEFAFGEEISEIPAVPPVTIEPQPEILAGYEQTFEPEAISREVPTEAPEEAPPTPPPPPVSLTEEQLRAILSQVSRDVIEKIAWEVVPDLAEMLIKEEIKRLQKK